MFRFFVASFFLVFSCFASAKNLDPFQCQNSPITDFINWASHETGKNFIISSDIHTTVTLNIPSLDESAVLPLVESVLSANGLQLTFSNNIYSISQKSSTQSIDSTQQLIESKPPVPLFTRVFLLNNSSNEKIAPILTAHISYQSTNQQFSVSPLPNSNSILVTAPKESIEKIASIIPQIDTISRMIHIEAVILETSVSNNDFTGINLKSKLSQNGFSFLSNSTSNTLPSVSGNLLYSVGGDIRGLLTSLSNDANSKILSTPNLLVLDREKASISVGQNVPFISSRSVSDGGTSLQQIQRRDVGISLMVTPHVLENGSVYLSIHQESSSLDNSPSNASDLITNTRSLDTVVLIHSGESIMLGGLINDDTKTSGSNVPLLKKIPILRSLFKSSSHDNRQRELTMILKANFI